MGYYSETIQKGSSGDSTKKWQEFLKSQGYDLEVDGIFGNITDKYTREYQAANGLTVDGIVGKNTWGAAGFSDLYTPISAPTIPDAPTMPTFNTTAFGDTEQGKAARDAKQSAEDAVANYGDFSWDKQVIADETLDSILNRPKFSYDFNTDALYQQYKDKYIQQGKMAMADTIGQASAMTGGYGNSYAATVGNQAYQAHLDELNDIVPELYQMAYDRYNQEGQDLYNKYGLLMDDHDRAYAMWGDGYDKLVDERAFASDDYYKQADLYGTEVDRDNSLAQAGYENEFGAWEAETDNAWTKAEWDEAARQYEVAQEAANQTPVVSDTAKNTDNKGTVKPAYTSPKDYLRDGINDGATTQEKNINSIKTYDDAAALLESYNIHSSNMMTSSEWNTRKSSYQITGEGGEAVTNYDNYTQYIRAYVRFQLDQAGKLE